MCFLQLDLFLKGRASYYRETPDCLLGLKGYEEELFLKKNSVHSKPKSWQDLIRFIFTMCTRHGKVALRLCFENTEFPLNQSRPAL